MSPRGACGGVPDGTCSAPGTFWVLGGGTSSAVGISPALSGGISSGGSTSPLLSFASSSLTGSVPEFIGRLWPRRSGLFRPPRRHVSFSWRGTDRLCSRRLARFCPRGSSSWRPLSIGWNGVLRRREIEVFVGHLGDGVFPPRVPRGSTLHPRLGVRQATRRLRPWREIGLRPSRCGYTRKCVFRSWGGECPLCEQQLCLDGTVPVLLPHPAEEFRKLLVAFPLGILDVSAIGRPALKSVNEYEKEVGVYGVSASCRHAASGAGHTPDYVIRIVDCDVRCLPGPLAPAFGHTSASLSSFATSTLI